MSKTGFFTKWIATDSWVDRQQYDRLDEQSDDLNVVEGIAQATAHQVQRLLEVDKQQQLEIQRLRVTVNVLVQMLAEAGVLDGKVLGYRIDAAFAELAPPPEEVAAQRAAHAGARDPMMACTRCKLEFLMSELSVTPDGYFCPECSSQ